MGHDCMIYDRIGVYIWAYELDNQSLEDLIILLFSAVLQPRYTGKLRCGSF
jgi:hypothetical protein